MTKFDGDRAEAEAELRRASDALIALEDDLAIAEERSEAIEQETPASPEEEADCTGRMEIVQREIEDLQTSLGRVPPKQRNRLLEGPGLTCVNLKPERVVGTDSLDAGLGVRCRPRRRDKGATASRSAS